MQPLCAQYTYCILQKQYEQHASMLFRIQPFIQIQSLQNTSVLHTAQCALYNECCLLFIKNNMWNSMQYTILETVVSFNLMLNVVIFLSKLQFAKKEMLKTVVSYCVLHILINLINHLGVQPIVHNISICRNSMSCMQVCYLEHSPSFQIQS